MAIYLKPDFICIGPEKTGTTWLYTVLNQSKEVELAPLKEIRYFNEGDFIPLYNSNLDMLSNHWSDQKLAKLYQKEVKNIPFQGKLLSKTKKKRYAWFLHFFNTAHTDSWYSNLFAKDYISGDISPTYNFIKEDKIKDIAKSFPELKIIIILRNPIDRLWAKAMMNLCQHTKRKLDQISDKEFDAFFQEEFALWTPYPILIEQWQKYFSHVHIAYFDQLNEKPEDFLAEITHFLGISDFAIKNISKKVNAGLNFIINDKYKKLLEDFFKEEINQLKKHLNSNYLDTW